MSRKYRVPGGDLSGRAERSPWATYGRICRVCLLLGMTSCALVGALTASAYVVLVIAPVCGLTVAGVGAIHVVDKGKKPEVRRALVLIGAWTALLVPAAAGIRALGAAGAMILFLLMVLAASVVSGWIAELCDPSRQNSDTGRDMAELEQLLHVLPTSMLLHEWHSNGENLESVDAGRRADADRVRALLLHELSRRDPAGVSRWLRAGEEAAPERYLRGDSAASP